MRMFGGTGFRLVVLGAAIVVAAGCTTTGTPTAAPSPTASPTAASPEASGPPSMPAAPTGTCPVTVPRPVPATEPWRQALFGSESAYGNGSLWVGGLGPGGVLDVGPELIDADRAVSIKFGWWRAVSGTLRITGRRLDGAAPPARSNVPDGYGDIGFQSSGVSFPVPGCWEVTGVVGTASLTFVTLVRTHG
jgi:hypothetical protein